jgi:hypothetical protein
VGCGYVTPVISAHKIARKWHSPATYYQRRPAQLPEQVAIGRLDLQNVGIKISFPKMRK